MSERKLTNTSLRRYPEGIVKNPVILSEPERWCRSHRRAANVSELSSAPRRSWLTRKVQALQKILLAPGRASGTF